MATKSTKTEEEVKLNIELKGVKAKLQTARVALMNKCLNKTGKNDFAHFDFFQLKDFLPEAQKIFTKLGLTSNYTIMPRVIAVVESHNEAGNIISKEPIIRDIARLVIKDIETEDTEIFEMEAAPVQIGNNTKQNIYQAAGGRSTYYKRYLYRDALEIEENDECDAVLGDPNVQYQQAPVQPVTPYSFQAPQPTSIQQTIVEQSIGQPVTIAPNGTVNVQQMPMDTPQQIEQKTNVVLGDSLITQASKEEAMNLIMQKGLNGYEVISSYCQQNGIASPADLKESDKVGLMTFIGNM